MKKVILSFLLSAGVLMAEGGFVGVSLGSTSVGYDFEVGISGYGTYAEGSDTDSSGGLALQGGYDFDQHHRLEIEYITYASNFDYFGVGYMYKHPIDAAITPFGGIGLGIGKWDDIGGIDFSPSATFLKLKVGGLYAIEKQHEIEFGVSYAMQMGEMKETVEDPVYVEVSNMKITRFYVGYNYHF